MTVRQLSQRTKRLMQDRAAREVLNKAIQVIMQKHSLSRRDIAKLLHIAAADVLGEGKPEKVPAKQKGA
jgi:hypothetical protein